jgi:putative ABC transport system permease protein
MPHDLRQALRLLRLNPGFTTLAILTLALGIGACVTMFSIVNGVLLRPLPYPQPDRIVALWEVAQSGSTMQAAWPNFLDWHEQSRTLDGIAAHTGGTTTVLGGTEPQRADAYYVSEDFFRVLGVTPRLGRPFSDAEQRPGGTPVAIVSDDFWRHALGGGGGGGGAGSETDLAAVHGKTITLDGVVAQVVGVMPAGFAFPSDAAV